MLVPGVFGGQAVTAVVVDGQAASAPSLVVNGRTMRAFTLTRPASGAPRSVSVHYELGTPAITVGNLTVTEGHTGTTIAQLPVSLSPPSSNTVTVQFQTANGTATQPADYQASSGTLTFSPFQTSQTVPLTIVGDTIVEGPHSFSVTLSNPNNATIEDGVGIVTIVDDDAVVPTITISDASVTEGHSGTTPATLTVSLSQASSGSVSVQYATAGDTATTGVDFSAAAGTLTFAPGVTSLPLAVQVLGDTSIEPNETFLVNLSSPINATVGDGQGVGTIVNDDAGGATTTATFQVQTGGDDATEEGGGFTADAATVWAGSGPTAASSFTGLRFGGVTIPAGATISSAYLELHAASAQWLTVGWQYGVEASANSAPFSAGSRPSRRPMLPPTVTHASDEQWLADTWYPLDEIAPLVQAAVNQPGVGVGERVVGGAPRRREQLGPQVRDGVRGRRDTRTPAGGDIRGWIGVAEPQHRRRDGR